jgi:hypothetical protein
MRPTDSLAALVLIALLGSASCDTEDPTTVVVDNAYPVVPAGGDVAKEMTVFKVWWVTSLLPDAVPPGGAGQPERTVPNSDFAYALLAPGWDPSSPAPPPRLFAAKSASRLSAARGDTLHIHVSDDTFVGNCNAARPLSQDDATFITTRIFPAEFARMIYDSKSCTARAEAGD